MKTQELNQNEMKAVNGGALLGLLGDDSMIKGVTEGYLNLSHTDDDGETESTNISFGSGSIFQSQND
jgi:hypothetical protein